MPTKKTKTDPQTEMNPELNALLRAEEAISPPDANAALQTDAGPVLEDAPSDESSDPREDFSKSGQTDPEEKKDEHLCAEDKSNPPQSDGAASAKTPAAPKRPTLSRQRTRVVTIDAQRTVETETDKANNDLLDLLESLRSNRILTDRFHGVERVSENSNQYVAVLYHGSYKVMIPVEEAVEPPRDYRGMNPGTVLQYLVNKRLGAEVDYIVKGVDQASGAVVASRLEAMRAKRRRYYFGTDRDGNNLLYEGACAEARVVSTIRAGIFVDLFGVETYIPLSELSYQRMLDATHMFQPGQRVLVKIIELDRRDREHISVTASVKRAGENPYEKALRMYSAGSCYVGTVTVVDTNGVFVALDGGIDCLCRYPKRGRPPRGSRVTVRILGINLETNRIWGAITHIAAPH